MNLLSDITNHLASADDVAIKINFFICENLTGGAN